MALEIPVTELDAVNTMLTAIGESPVNSLSEGSVAAVSIAQSILKEVSHAVQMEGWHFNTESNYPLTPNVSGAITLPQSIIRVDLDSQNDTGDYDLVQRGTTLYDRKNRTAVFTRTLKAEVVLLFSFDELPPVARRYISVRAARVLQGRMVGSETLHGFTQIDELNARLSFEEAEGENADWSIFDNYDVARSVDRNHGYRG
jgi:hypothetical protein